MHSPCSKLPLPNQEHLQGTNKKCFGNIKLIQACYDSEFYRGFFCFCRRRAEWRWLQTTMRKITSTHNIIPSALTTCIRRTCITGACREGPPMPTTDRRWTRSMWMDTHTDTHSPTQTRLKPELVYQIVDMSWDLICELWKSISHLSDPTPIRCGRTRQQKYFPPLSSLVCSLSASVLPAKSELFISFG